ncbi:MAG: hypothetical protein IPP69_13835 [Flavobacteriales bacterium]|nr:hypothetical protein [Flavobacteriales bacterium]
MRTTHIVLFLLFISPCIAQFEHELGILDDFSSAYYTYTLPGDCDDDGDVDVLAMLTTDKVVAYLNDGTGQFSEPTSPIHTDIEFIISLFRIFNLSI